MTIGQSMLPEFDAEMANTRKVLERIPDDKLGWKIHEKSNSIGWVANHLADIPGWVGMALNHNVFDVNPPDGEAYQQPDEGSVSAILELFDNRVAEGRALLEHVTDDQLQENWSLASGGDVIMTMPRIDVLRTWVLNHSIHHRAHLCVYLRVNEIAVPGLYGPSGDES